MEFRVLGPLEVIGPGGPITIGSGLQRAALAVLALHLGETISSERLIDELWADHPPRGAQHALEVHVSSLRRALGADRIDTQPNGYRLRAEGNEVDLGRFEAIVSAASQSFAEGDPRTAAAGFASALALWRGPALGDLPNGSAARSERARLDELRALALERRIDADLACGRHTDVVPELRRIVAEMPLREAFHARLMLALYRSGRQAEALDVYLKARDVLDVELGVEPGPELEALQRAVLEHDPALSFTPSAGRPSTTAAASESVVVPASTAKPLYGRTFVGREAELRQAQQAFDGVLSGQGAVITVVGEPGIGKTALTEQLATYVGSRGGRALIGHCYEEGSPSLPYLAFVDAMRTYVLSRDPAGLRSDLGTGAADVARILSEVRDRISGVELHPAGNPEDDRWRLLQSVTSFVRNASSAQPLLIVLEDLHWADRGTLDLLLFVARNLQGARLLVVGTYRDVEVDRTHPLSGTLAELRRIANFARITLRGLTVDEVHQMLTILAAREIAPTVAEAVHRQTEGNPLFIQEVLRYLVEEGLITGEAGRLRSTTSTPLEMSIPEGLRDVIGKRLSRLSSECNRLLSVAAVIGRDFDLETLRRVDGRPEDELLSAIEQAVHIGVVEERSLPGAVRYRFAHALFRQTLYEEMIAPRRLRLHQEVARTLEAQYATRRGDHAGELAEHFGQSTDLADLAKAVTYSELAAQRAMSVYAYGEAASHLERCLGVLEVLDPDDTVRRCDLMLALGDALAPAGDPYRAAQYAANEAWKLAEGLGDRRRAFRAYEIAFIALFRYHALFIATLPEFREWLERVGRLDPSSPAERIMVNVGRAVAFYTTGAAEEFHAALVEALDLANEIDSHLSKFQAAWFLAILPAAPSHEPQRRRLVHAALDLPRDGVSLRAAASLLGYGGASLLGWGDRIRAESLWRQVDEMADRTGDPGAIQVNFVCQALRATLDGDLERAIATVARLKAQAEEMGSNLAGQHDAVYGSLTALLHLGRYAEARRSTEFLEVFRDQGQLWLNTHIALSEAYAGQHSEAQGLLTEFLAHGRVSDETTPELTMFLQTALLLGDTEAVRLIAAELVSVAGDALILGDSTCVARHLGAASALLGKVDEARGYYLQALDVAAGIRFRPEIALTRLALAELLLEYYPDERTAAVEHLDFAIAELRDMKMQPALERALRHQGLLVA